MKSGLPALWAEGGPGMRPSTVASQPQGWLHLSDLSSLLPPPGLALLPVARLTASASAPPWMCSHLQRGAGTQGPSPPCSHRDLPLPSQSGTGTSLLSHLDCKPKAGGKKEQKGRGRKEREREEKPWPPHPPIAPWRWSGRWGQVGPGAWASPSR